METNKVWHTKRKGLVWFLSILLSVSLFLGGLQLGMILQMNTWEHWRPNYAKEDISQLIVKEALTEEDYRLLYRQTGLTRLGVDGLRNKGNAKRILEVQESYFETAELEVLNFTMFTNIDYIDHSIVFGDLQEGDIVVSACTYVSGFRFGHSALVVDGENEIILECYSLGTYSKLERLGVSMGSLANAMVLRPKLDESVRRNVADRAASELLGIPYFMFTGVFSPKYTERLERTQCTHIIWYAYKKYAGVDLDGNGGLVVKPRDIFRSEQMELVQVYGFNPETLWN